MTDEPRSRRRVLGALGAAVLAGCSGGPSSDETTGAPRSTADGAGGTPSPGDGTETATDATTTEQTTAADPPPPPGSGGSWSVPGYDLGNTGYNPDAAGPGGDVRRVWGTDVDGIYTMAQVAVGDGRLFTASGESAYAMDPANGDMQWSRDLEYLGHHYPVGATGDLVYVPTRTIEGSTQGGGSGKLYALDVETGEAAWTQATPITTAAVPVDDALYYGASTGDRSWLSAVDRTTGAEAWRHDLAETEGFLGVFGAPAVAGSLVVSTATVNGGAGYDTRGLAFAVDRETGERVWERSFDAPIAAAPVVTGDRAFVVTRGGEAAALSLSDGSVAWSRTFDGEFYSTPATDGDVLVGLLRGELVGMAADSGSVRWRTELGVVLVSGLALTDSTVYVGGKDLRALDRTNGEIRWEYPIPDAGGGFGGPVVTGETVFVGACVKRDRTSRYDDSVYALQRARGSE